LQPDAVAVVTYPGHALTTVLTIRNLLELTSWTVPVHVFIDDQGPQYQQWPSFLEQYQQLLNKQFPSTVFVYHKFSDFNFAHIWDGWLRQQMVKLNLDRVLPGNQWYVTDGDVQLTRVLDINETPFNFVTNLNPLLDQQNESYLGHMLGISDPRIRYQDRAVFTHLAPFRWVHRHHLDGLRRFVTDRLHNDFNISHTNLMRQERIIGYGNKPTDLSMTEWDLIELYRERILGEDIGLRYWINQTNELSVCDHEPSMFWTFFGTDRDLGIEWFADLHVSEDLWTQIQAITRT
jgi:hypothetical protein